MCTFTLYKYSGFMCRQPVLFHQQNSAVYFTVLRTYIEFNFTVLHQIVL